MTNASVDRLNVTANRRIKSSVRWSASLLRDPIGLVEGYEPLREIDLGTSHAIGDGAEESTGDNFRLDGIGASTRHIGEFHGAPV